MARTTLLRGLAIRVFSLILCFSGPGFAQQFGKNSVQYTHFDWHFIQSRHFDVYFYPGGDRAAQFVADVAESSYVELSRSFDYELRKRIVILLYSSHNDFEQTNLSYGVPQESVGGFTEFYKNRIAIPYSGSYEQLRHVTHHELTHAVMLQMMFGTGAFSIVTGMPRANIPLWFVEGMAEYQSRHGWDTESDMFMRDATITGYLPPIYYLYGFMAYKGGQSVLNYIANRYGKEKIGELLAQTRRFKDVEQGMMTSLGMGVTELTKDWHRHLQKTYWPEVKDRQEPGEFARQITFHRDDRNFINNSGELSPQADKIAYLSDRSGYFDIYLVSAIDGGEIAKLVSGQRSGRLEELHWLRPGITWHPAGDRIAFAAKSREQDALHIVDIASRKITASYKFDMDAIFGPAWSPDGHKIAFVGSKDGASDIYLYDLESAEVRQITSDIFSDLEPRWSSDGSRLVFVSDRGAHLSGKGLQADFEIQNTDYHQFDVYTVGATSGKVTRITDTRANEKSPVWSPDGSKVAFVSDRSGIFNIYVRRLPPDDLVLVSNQKLGRIDSTRLDFSSTLRHEPVVYPITNVLTGIDHLSWQGQRLSFTSFHEGGFDIYLINEPLHVRPGELELAETEFVQSVKAALPFESPLIEPAASRRDSAAAFSEFVFGKKFRKGEPVSEFAPSSSLFLEPDEYLSAGGEYKVKEYKRHFSPDIITANAGYDPHFGFQGATLFAFSDLMGNHRFNFLTDVFVDYKNSDFAFGYQYLPRQTDYSLGIYQRNYLFLSRGRFLVRDHNFGLRLQMTRSFDRYSRVSYGLHWKYIIRDGLVDYEENQPDLGDDSRSVVLTNVAYVKDNVIWGATGPKAGSRYTVSLLASPDLGGKGLDFRVYQLDYRTYVNFARNYSYAFRFAAGLSEGRHRQKFFLGGLSNWINLKFRQDIAVQLDNVYFSNFVSPLRGFDYYAQVGSRFFVANFELRVPFVNYVHATWPLPLRLRNIRGTLFVDLGSAWDRDFNFFTKEGPEGARLDDVLMSFGWGARVNLGMFLLKYDQAWPTDLNNVASGRHLFSLGVDF